MKSPEVVIRVPESRKIRNPGLRCNSAQRYPKSSKRLEFGMQVPMIRNQESRDKFNKTSTSVFTNVAVILESENNGYNPGQNVWDT